MAERTLSSLRPSWPPPSAPSPDVRSRSTAGSWFSTVFDRSLASLAGTHRIQRVPNNEKRGRRHSSIVTVVALDERAATSLQLDKGDVLVHTYRDTGPGGQHRNKTDSAVRLTHKPTGVVVTAVESRSQHENRRVAWARLETELGRRQAENVAQQANQGRQEVFDQGRSWTWTAWRDQVSGPGRSASMKQALKGRLGSLVS